MRKFLLLFCILLSSISWGCDLAEIAAKAELPKHQFGPSKFHKRFLVTGASGFVGSRVVEMLAAHEQIPVPFIRYTSQQDRLKVIAREFQYGDLAERDALEDAASNVDVIIHTAAKVSDWGTYGEFRRANVDGTRNVLDAAVKKGVKRFIHISTADVFGLYPTSKIIDDSFPYRKSGYPYADTKIIAEQLVFEYAAKYGLEVTVIRPTWIYGPGDRQFFQGLIDTMGTIYVTNPENRISLNYVDNLMYLMWLAINDDRSIGQAYLSDDNDPISWRELMWELARQTGYHPPRVALPKSGGMLLGTLAEMALGALELLQLNRVLPLPNRPPISRYAVDFLGSDHVYSPAKAMNELGYRPLVTRAEGFPKTVEALKLRKP